jgi:hypothetical protein
MMPVSLEIARIGWSRAFMQFKSLQIILSYIYLEIITGWSGNCVIKRLEMQGRSRPPAAV